jgi:hypothetical protein
MIISRKDAKASGLKYYFTGKPCKNEHISERLVSCKNCIQCFKDWKSENKEKVRDAYKKWRKNNPEKARLKNKIWAEKNPEKVKEKIRRWGKENKGKKNATTAKRRENIKQATPPWSDLKKIENIYIKAARLSERTGIPHHVDHILPLKNKLVCGLHVYWNLRIITAKENLSKGNKLKV